MIDKCTKEDALLRLRKIEGQIKGIHKMVEGERYCIDIINQVSAVSKALNGVALSVMKRHLESCVTEAAKAGKSQSKIKELIETIHRFVK